MFNPGETPAVTRTVGDDVMGANTRYGLIYASGLSSNNSGKCLLVDFTYDAADPDMMNVNENGYYTVRLQNQVSVNQQDIKSELTAVDVLLPNELPVLYGLSPVAQTQQYFDCIDNYLFLPSIYVAAESQNANWEMSYDPVETHSSTSLQDGQSVYDVYLRVTATSGRTEEAKDTVKLALNAFNLAPLLNTIGSQGGTTSRGVYIAIHYINGINPLDSTQFTWGATEPLQIK